MESLKSYSFEHSRFTELAIGVSVSCMPTTSIACRHLKSTYSRSDTTPDRPALSRETDLSSRVKRYKRKLGFGSSLWQSMGESQSDLMCDTTIAMDNRRTTEAVVEGGPPPNGMPGHEIHYTTRIQAHSESREPKAVSKTKPNDNLC